MNKPYCVRDTEFSDFIGVMEWAYRNFRIDFEQEPEELSEEDRQRACRELEEILDMLDKESEGVVI